MSRLVLLTLFLTFVSNLDSASSQDDRREFIESSSVLKNGDRVTSRSEPGRNVQTVITVSAESIAKRRDQAERDRIDLTSQRERAGTSNGTTGSGSAQSVVDEYPYPAAPRVADIGQFRNPVGSNRVGNRQTAYQLPTLGIGRVQTARRAQLYQDCNCNPQTFGAGRAIVPAAQTPSLQVQPPALTIQDPTQVGTGFQQPVAQPVYQQPYLNAATQPRFGFQNNSSWWNPIVTGSGVYQPIVRLANIRPGTYLGQGIIGQPTAYVDGQPVRNLLRYIFP